MIHRLPPEGFRKARTCVETLARQFAYAFRDLDFFWRRRSIAMPWLLLQQVYCLCIRKMAPAFYSCFV